MPKIPWYVLAGMATAIALAACGDSAISPGRGSLVVQLKDAPFPLDSIKSVDVYVVRVDGRQADATEADAEATANDDNASTDGWTTLASPNATIDLLTLQNGTTTTLGQASLAAGNYSGFRLVIDPSKSSLTLKNGLTLTNTSTPSVSFPSASRSGIKIQLENPLEIASGGTTTMVVDFDVGNSFVLRGNSLSQNGLLFTPVVKATVK